MVSVSKRCFAFGCSYTQYMWPTAADLIGSNYSEFYNFGISGADNTHALNRLIDTHSLFKLNPKTDFVIFGTTGHGRYTYWDRKSDWVCQGDYDFSEQRLAHNNKFFKEEEFGPIWAIYRSVNAIRMFKYFLEALSIPHIIFPAIDNVNFCMKNIYKHERRGFEDIAIQACESLSDVYNIQTSMDEFMMETKTFHNKTYFKKENWYETHPSTEIHYNYLKTFMPEYDTDTVRAIVSQFTSKEYSDYNSLKELMAKKFELIHRKDLKIEPSLFLRYYPFEIDIRKKFRDSGL